MLYLRLPKFTIWCLVYKAEIKSNFCARKKSKTHILQNEASCASNFPSLNSYLSNINTCVRHAAPSQFLVSFEHFFTSRQEFKKKYSPFLADLEIFIIHDFGKTGKKKMYIQWMIPVFQWTHIQTTPHSILQKRLVIGIKTFIFAIGHFLRVIFQFLWNKRKTTMIIGSWQFWL